MSSRSLHALGCTAALLTLGIVACSATSEVDPFGGSAEDEAPPPGSGGSGAGGTTTTGGLDPGDKCDPPCDSTKMCSTTGACIEWGTCAADEDCEDGLVCDPTTSTCTPGGGCGAQEIAGAQPTPNVLIVLDRSCSMTHKNKWSYAVDAVLSMVTTFGSSIRFGLTLFPDPGGDGCTQGSIPIPIGDGKGPAIEALLDAALSPLDVHYPQSPCNTNIDSAMNQAATKDPSLGEPEHPSYVLLITDGKQEGCSLSGGDAGTLQIIEGLLQNDGVKTFIVGFGSGVYAPMLNTFAEAGGVPYSDPNDPFVKFYEADDKPQLEAALQTIGAKALGCVFDLDTPPPDPSQVFVFFNDDPKGVPNDPVNGWTYDPATNQVTFHGTSCDLLESAWVQDVDIVYGCNEPTPDPK